MNSPTSVFSLSHRDCEEFKDALSAKADEYLEAMDFGKNAALIEVRSMFHDLRMKSYQRRSDKRRAKRRQSLDASTCKDG